MSETPSRWKNRIVGHAEMPTADLVAAGEGGHAMMRVWTRNNGGRYRGL